MTLLFIISILTLLFILSILTLLFIISILSLIYYYYNIIIIPYCTVIFTTVLYTRQLHLWHCCSLYPYCSYNYSTDCTQLYLWRCSSCRGPCSGCPSPWGRWSWSDSPGWTWCWCLYNELIGGEQHFKKIRKGSAHAEECILTAGWREGGGATCQNSWRHSTTTCRSTMAAFTIL